MRHPAYVIRSTGLLLLVLLIALPASAQSLEDFDVAPILVPAPDVTQAGKTDLHAYRFDATSAFNGVLIRGWSPPGELSGWILFEDDPTRHPLTFLRGPRDEVFIAGFRSETYRQGAAFTLQLESPSGLPVTLDEAGVFDNRRDADRRFSDTPIREETPSLQGAIVPPALINRSTWGARGFIGTPEPLAQPAYTRMSFHHAACCSAYTREEGIAQLKAIQIFHQDVRGWSDIGYQFLLDQEGRVYQGRPFMDSRPDLARPPRLAMGAHVGGANTGNIGVSVLGCYHPAEGPGCVDVLSPAAYDSLITLFAYLSENYGVPAQNLLGHRDQGATSCPGDNNYTLLPSIRTDIVRRIAEGNAPLARASLIATDDSEGVVTLEGTFTEVIDVASIWVERDAGGQVVRVFERDGSGDFVWTDGTVAEAGTVRYSLFVRSANGREQAISETPVVLDAPAGYALHPVFPNPTSSTALVRYYLPREGLVRLDLFSPSGRHIQSLADTYQDGERWYAVPISTAGLASGTYFYRFTVEGFAGIDFDATRALVVVR